MAGRGRAFEIGHRPFRRGPDKHKRRMHPRSLQNIRTPQHGLCCLCKRWLQQCGVNPDIVIYDALESARTYAPQMIRNTRSENEDW